MLYGDERCLVTEYVPGSDLDADRLRATPEAVVRALRAFHDSGLELPASFWIPDLLVGYAALLSQRGVAVGDRYRRTQGLVDEIAAALPLREPVACHNDLLPGNLMSAGDDSDRPMLVDWEYAGMGHRWFDLGNLAVNNAFDSAAEDRLLSAYFDGEPPTAGRRAALRCSSSCPTRARPPGGSCRARSPSSTSTSAPTPTSTSAGCGTRRADQSRLRGWLSEATRALPELTPSWLIRRPAIRAADLVFFRPPIGKNDQPWPTHLVLARSGSERRADSPEIGRRVPSSGARSVRTRRSL